jgi:hypothetical protein
VHDAARDAHDSGARARPDRGTVSTIEDPDKRLIGRRAVDEGRRPTGCTGLFVPEPTLVAQAHSEGRLEDRPTHA